VRRTADRRVVAFAVLVVACVAVAVVAVVTGVSHRSDADSSASPGVAKVLGAAAAKGEAMVLYRSTRGVGTGDAGPVEVAPLAHPGQARRTGLRCNRVYYAAGHGICLARGGGFAAGYQARIFDSTFRVGKSIGVTGIPSRARVSPDGRYGSVTLFVSGDSYAAAGTFSTRTTIIDLVHGTSLGGLENWTTYDGQHQVTASDVNYWGVTFAPGDSDRFYATMSTGGKTYLIQGSVSQRTAKVLHDNVECPSLSPDGTRIGFKHRTGSSSAPWRLTVLDLATMKETRLAETRSVDDQVAWDGDDALLYAVGGATWSVPADGGGRPRRMIGQADSPAVVATRQAAPASAPPQD
jgi:hypothetical protein